MQGEAGNRLFRIDLGDGVSVTATDSPSSPLLDAFFAGYDRAFILPDEREELDGFRACLTLNATHRFAYGRIHSELIAVFRDQEGALLGGANFLAIGLPAADDLPPVSIALNYVYVEERARGRGLLRLILDAVGRLAFQALELDPSGAAPAIFIEQNDPLRLTEEEYRADTAHSGTDQVDRLAIWARVGTRVVDFGYVQPPLSDGQMADDGLLLGAVGYPGKAVHARLLHDHLESFFGISVFKGRPEPPGGIASSQIAALAARADPVALLPMEPALAWLRTGSHRRKFSSFRELARAASRED